MISKQTDNITCLLLGHNFYRPTLINQESEKVICKNCGCNSQIDNNGDFNQNIATDRSFVSALRTLFYLRKDLSSSI